MAGINRVEANGEVLLDLTEDTVTPASLRSGFTAHDRNGDLITGEGGGIAAIDDSAGIGDIDKVWSADKSAREIASCAPADSPQLTGTPTAPTAAAGTNTTQIATTAFVKAGLDTKANTASPTFTGTPKAPTASTSTNNTQIATTAFVKAALAADKASPVFTGTPTAPTAAADTNTTQIATTAFVKTAVDNSKVSPAFSGTPTAPTADVSTNTTQIATTAFVKNALNADKVSPDFSGTPTAPTADISTDTTQIATTEFVHDILEDAIDDEAGLGDTDKVFSADRTKTELNGKANAVSETFNGKIVTFENNYDNSFLKDLVIDIEPIQSGSGDPSPSNIREISGFNNVIVARTSENLWSSEMVLNSKISSTGIASDGQSRTIYIPVEAGKTYVMHKTASSRFRVGYTNVLPENDVEISYYENFDNTYIGDVNYQFTVPEGMLYFVSQIIYTQRDNISVVLDSVFIGEGETYSISLQSDAGTVYGGSFNVITGELIIDRLLYTPVTSHIKQNAAPSNSFYIDKTKLPALPLNSLEKCLSNKFIPKNSTESGIFFFNSSDDLRFNTLYVYSSVSEMVSEYGEITFVYQIATPIVYQLSKTEIATLIGTNAVCSDAGNVTITHYLDTKTFVDDSIKNKSYEKADVIQKTMTGPVVSFDDGSELPIKQLIVNIEPIQSGSGDPSLDNIRPISGTEEISIIKTRKNLLPDKRYVVSTRVVMGQEVTYNADKKIFLHPGTYTLHVTYADNEPIGSIYYGGANGAVPSTRISITDTAVFTITQKGYYAFWIYNSLGLDGDKVLSFQLEPGDKATAYEPYDTNNEYHISFSDIGTVYGGYLNVLTGDLVVTKKMVVVDGVNQTVRLSTKTNPNGLIVNYAAVTADYYRMHSSLMCDKLVKVSKSETLLTTSECRTNANSAGTMTYTYFIIPSEFEIETVEEANAWLADGHNYTFVYELTNPITYHLSPVQILTLLGHNYIYSNGDNLTLEYRADTKLYIDQKIAESQRATRSLLTGIETDMVATKNYVIGDLLIVGDTLYKVTANIANGSAISTETNVVATTVAEQLILLAQA